MNLDKVSLSVLPRWLDICTKRHLFHFYHCIVSKRLDLKNGQNTQPKLPLLEYFTIQRTTVIIHHRQIRTVEEQQGGPKSIQKEFYTKPPCKVPNILAITKILKRLKEETALLQIYFEQNPKCHVRQAARVLDLSYGEIWRILRKNLKWKAYKPHLTQCLGLANKESRSAACTFWLSFEGEWFQRVIWSD